MSKFIRVGNQVINLELITNAYKDIEDGQTVVSLFFNGPDRASIVLYSDEAEQFWDSLVKSNLELTSKNVYN